MASFQSLPARSQSAVMFLRASQISLIAASSVGKWPRVLKIERYVANIHRMRIDEKLAVLTSDMTWYPCYE